MLGDAEGMEDARHRSAAAMDQLSPSAATSGVYSVPRADDPPYTATSLLLTGKYQAATETTRRLIDTAYRPRSRAPGDQPTNYARTLLILALAAAGLGETDEAAAVGAAALECGRVVWPTMVLAGKLDQSLARTSPGAPHAADFHARYIDAGRRLALPPAARSDPQVKAPALRLADGFVSQSPPASRATRTHSLPPTRPRGSTNGNHAAAATPARRDPHRGHFHAPATIPPDALAWKACGGQQSLTSDRVTK